MRGFIDTQLGIRLSRQARNQQGFALVKTLMVIGIFVALAAVIVTLAIQLTGGRVQAAENAKWDAVQTSIDTMMAIDWLYSRLALELKTKEMHPGTYRYLDRLIQIKRRLQAGGNPNKSLLWEELMLDWQHLLSLAPPKRAG